MTISPPAKVKLGPEDTFKVLTSGIDSLYLAIDIHWENEDFFEYLREMKALAVETERDQVIQFPQSGLFSVVKPYGRKGHQWIIENNDFEMTLGDWLTPKSRPSAMVTFRSEALWRLGPHECVALIGELFRLAHAEDIKIKPSRVDLCLDMTFPDSEWFMDLIYLRVTRSTGSHPYLDNNNLTGISIGRGNIAARLYDKPFEIRRKSKKYWVYDIWGIEEEVPESLRIIRTEGQFRREALRELGIDTIDDLFDHIEKLWGYFTQKWLKFATNPGEHHTMRKLLPWWEIVQNGFLGVQQPTPLIRCKAIQPRKKQLFAQSYGTMTSFMACCHEEMEMPIGCSVTTSDLSRQFNMSLREYGKSDFELEMDLQQKRAKRDRAMAKMYAVDQQRKALGLPSTIKLNPHSGQKPWPTKS
ncbi:hypothetical protein [Desulfofustis limnaeus]|uniref:Replication initiation factor n=1 Tax=Desulfofustis limnaeus TaxID=2740163 RepID=A0ABN6M547_9BACT|nr:hypothetical protein [Desulfofustis limnaeus]BDD87030.1 hypothetical protein DPPLL_13950 [Desulfofustis limnaeus]